MRINTVRIGVPGAVPQEFLHITDLHIALADERDSEAVRAHSAGRIALFEEQGGCHTPDALRQLTDYAVEHGMPIVLTGDICDFPSAANLDALREQLGRTVGYHLAIGNHDYNFGPLDSEGAASLQRNAPALQSVYLQDLDLAVWDNGGVRYVFLNDNHGGQFSDEQADFLEQSFAACGQHLLFFHVPLYTPDLYDAVMGSWRQPIISCVPDEQAEGIYIPTAATRRVRALIAQYADKVAAVITGHLHFGHSDMLEPDVPQFVTPGAYQNVGTHFIIESI